MLITASSALWFLPFVLPICFYVAWSDMRAMRIPNNAVLALLGVCCAARRVEVSLWRSKVAGADPRRLICRLIPVALSFWLTSTYGLRV